MNVILFSHSAAGVLLVTEEEILALPDNELGPLVLKNIKDRYPSLVRGLGLDSYEEVFVTRYAEGDAQIEIMGDDGILYVDVAIKPVFGIKAPEHVMAEAMLAAI